MRIGLVPLAIGVAAASARVLDLEAAADVVAIVYLAAATLLMTRRTGLLALRT